MERQKLEARRVHVPPGVSLLLVGSGLYWILSSQLIASFTVLTPGVFQTVSFGQTLITSVGLISLIVGLWLLHIDVEEFRRLVAAYTGYIFVIPIMLAVLDVYSTTINLSLNTHVDELNPFVAAAIQYGPAAIVPFIFSYVALSQGLALLMLSTGRTLFGETNTSRFLPFTLIGGIASFGPFSNLLGMEIGYASFLVYLMAAMASALLSIIIWRMLRDPTSLRLIAVQ